MNHEIGRIQAGRPTSVTEPVTQREPVARSADPKPLLAGGLSVTVGAYHAPGEVHDVHEVQGVEEPSHEDPLGKLFGEVFDMPPPAMPNFI